MNPAATDATSECWHVWVDTGGTFTDCLATDPHGHTLRFKVLSSSCLRGTLTAIDSPNEIAIELSQPLFAGFALGQQFRLLGQADEPIEITGHDSPNQLRLAKPLPSGTALDQPIEIAFADEAPILAARIATGTPANQPLPPMAMQLATTRGTNALLEEKGAEVTLFITRGFEDLLVIGDQKRPDLFALNIQKPTPLTAKVVGVQERLDALGQTVKPLTLPQVAPPENENQSAAVVCLHSHRNPEHEQHLASHLRDAGWRHVSVSSELAPFIKVLPRAETAVVDAYLAPIMSRYLDGVERELSNGKLRVMTSAGGLVPHTDYRAKDSLLSGPAGGVVGAAMAGRQAGFERIIGFDMGGTSTDVCRFDGDFVYRFEHRVGRARVLAPVLAIETVAAGGGSICGYNGDELFVGPESAGANPGPACYDSDGPLTITDVNLLLGRLDPKQFSIPVNPAAALAALEQVRRSIPDPPPASELLSGFLDIANERMADAIRTISIREGYDPCDYALVAFGGAGGQHACAIAEKLGVGTVLCPDDAGLLSARGLREAVMERFAERQILQTLDTLDQALGDVFAELQTAALGAIKAEGFKDEQVIIRRRLVSLRHEGQESAEEIAFDTTTDLAAAFRERYENLFGYWPDNKSIEVVSARVIASTHPPSILTETFNDPTGEPINEPILNRESLNIGQRLNGPAIVQDRFCTVAVDVNWVGTLGSEGTLKLARSAVVKEDGNAVHSPLVELELFTNRFGSIVEEMGQLLQRTAVSTNVKERLDYSCALLDRNGQLVVNAPHIPVHLGALGLCVRSVAPLQALAPGDMIITNHPGHGGSHLPDITVISPVFDEAKQLLGYVANRAHHAELGGISPGSMPPQARSLADEGVVIPPTFLYRRGKARFCEFEKRLSDGSNPSRSPKDNLADLNAQAAANLLGCQALQHLAAIHGPAKIANHMHQIRQRATNAIARRIDTLDPGRHSAIETLDDGTRLTAAIEVGNGKIRIDFTGTDPLHPGNFNATPAIVQSAVIYVVRLLVNEPVPLNEGLMDHVEIFLPRCLLNPEFPDNPDQAPPVVGGNVETSQRLVNLLLKPLGIVAASQGTMNNLIFGNERCSYYETICGGAGAGPGFDGADAVHSHMTNTAITDPEILEWRFPVRLEQFAIRKNSGGNGLFTGGDGIIREMLFTEPVTLSLLTQNRTQGPYGLNGGQSGHAGQQHLVKHGGKKMELGPVTQEAVLAGDRLVIKTPGGGGWG
ncbi:MAG: hydantoinase B/oxoprolinase family protein [Verrucomicrobiota bacterium]|nr:hydantoinase B/oxoprolinase family protein [Verrucomicrobiota bacterium]